jgi:hypothetical protein
VLEVNPSVIAENSPIALPFYVTMMLLSFIVGLGEVPQIVPRIETATPLSESISFTESTSKAFGSNTGISKVTSPSNVVKDC